MELKQLKNLPDTACPVDSLLKAVHGHRCLDCGKCVYGYEGATQLELTLQEITQKKARSGDRALLERLCRLMSEQALCEDGVELAGAVLDCINQYGGEFDAHIAKRECRAGVCKKFVSYHILADRCVGCTDCMDACDEDAILGKKGFIHVIDQDECTQCGACKDACDEDAIVTAGAVKPRCPLKPIPCKH